MSEGGRTRTAGPPTDEADRRLLWRSLVRGSLIGGLVGDALGSPLAGQTGPVAEGAIGSLESVAARRAFTHDTAMAIGVAESLLFNGGIDQDHLARTLVVRHERRPDRGHGRVTASLLRRIGSGEDWRHAATSQLGGRGSPGSSAAARVTALGLWAADIHEAARLGHASAQVTHAHPVAVDAAGVQAAAIYLAAADRTTGPLPAEHFVADLVRVASTKNLAENLELALQLSSASPQRVAEAIGNGSPALQAVPAALCGFLHNPDSYPDAVRFAIRLGGNAGTIATMTGAIAGARLGETAVPVHWRAYTEGVDEMQELADRIVTRMLKPTGPSPRERFRPSR